MGGCGQGGGDYPAVYRDDGYQDPVPGTAYRKPVRRQPAEGNDWKMAGHRPQDTDSGRANQGRGRGRQV